MKACREAPEYIIKIPFFFFFLTKGKKVLIYFWGVIGEHVFVPRKQTKCQSHQTWIQENGIQIPTPEYPR